MARVVNVHRNRQRLVVDEVKQRELEEYLTREITDATSSRFQLEKIWRDLMRMYEGVPKTPVQNFPVENAPNVEITLGAIACDSIYASMIDLIYTANPLVTVRGMPKMPEDVENNKDTKAFQRFINWCASNEADVREASEDAILDDVQLGTGCLYIPWTEERYKGKTASIINRGPRVWAVPIEDFLTPGGTKVRDIDQLPWVGLRFWLTHYEMLERGARNNWDVDLALKTAAPDWVSTRREEISKHYTGLHRAGQLYEIFDIYCYYDIDGDGIREDLYIVFDKSSRKCLKIAYNPYDRRPIETMVYQRRPHAPYGLGVLQMLAPFQEELSQLHNYQTLNALLANCRIWKAREGRVPENMKIWPGRVIELMDVDDLKPEVMADTYSSLPQIQMMIMTLAERRVGANELAPSPKPSMFGSRMPGITAMSMMQQVNKRFTPAFDGAKNAIARSLMQCMYRYQEQILAGNTAASEHIYSILGAADGSRVVAILAEPSFDENMIVELTAASASINRESDRQNAMMLVQLLAGYYQRTLELVGIASSPETPQEVRSVAVKIAAAAGEVIDRTIRTFDQVRDPALFLIEVEEEMQAATQQQPQEGLGQLLEMFSQQGMGQGGEIPLLPEGMMQ
jgi:hypothetical protein